MKNSNLKRFMASLLAVVMIFSVVGISPAVFAERAVAPELKANSGEVIIKSGMTNDEVAQILNKALISNYDELDDATKASLQWEYKGYGYTKKVLGVAAKSLERHWGTINGNVSFTENHGITYKYVSEALKDADNGDYQVRLAGTTTEATLVKVDKYSTKVELKADASITYNMDAAAEKEAIVASVIDYEKSNLPEGTTAADFTVQLKTGITEFDTAYDNVPDTKINAGDGNVIRVKYNGNDTYKESDWAKATITVAKATVKVSVTPITKLYAGEEIDRNDFYTLNPNDPELDVYVLFVGVNSNMESCVNIKLSEDQEKLIEAISNAQKDWYDFIKDTESLTLKEKLQEGITFGELKEIINGIVTNKTIMGILELAGYDTEAIKNIVTALDKLTSLSDDTIIAIGTPAHAGLYVATAVAVGKNYETSEGTGSLIVLKNWKGIKLEKNPILNSGEKANTITVSQAEALKAGNNLCMLTKDGAALNSASAGSIHYWFTGVGKLYAKSAMPTAPGKYIVTASVRGGDFFAFPKTFTFTIVADPTPEVTPEA